ncbi:30S ribosomal protein S6 [Candidatus Daviesbacteria bacterium]|nr:30S ribosomal protein S6 [Candidatus Daviesbacteria bacterium]
MNNYNLTLVLKADLDESARKTLLDDIVKKTVGEDGKVNKEDFWGEKGLAYPIKRQTKGYVAHYELTADPKNVKSIDKLLKVEEDVLRYLLIRR